MAHHHGGRIGVTTAGDHRVALVGSPNSGKTTLFNALTGLHAKTGNYPGVTVARYEGTLAVAGRTVVVEDLPGTYSLDPISPDEQVVTDTLDPAAPQRPDALVVLLDSTTLRRSLGLLAHTLHVGLPTLVVLTFTDELAARQGRLDLARLERALGVRVLSVVAGDRDGVAALRRAMADLVSEPGSWPTPVVPPPTDPEEMLGWVTSVLDHTEYTVPAPDLRTRRIDAVLLHPVWGTLVFLVTMFVFFQTIFTLAAPAQGWIESGFGGLGRLASDHVGNGWLGGFVSDALLGGVGGVLVFLPQIVLLFVLIALLEGVGYMARAAFLMDRVMARAGLEGRAFVALLSSVACAIPGIMATRTLPSARDRVATMMGAPLMTCSARVPVYVLLIGMLVDPDARVGPIGAQGAVMFGLYVLGAVSAMATAWLFKKVTGRTGPVMPFYMEIPPYRLPRYSTVLRTVWEAARSFLRKVGVIILATTAVLWLLLNVPARSEADLRHAGVDPADSAAADAYVLDHSWGADLGHAIEPVFEPLGFDWRIDVSVISSLAAREVFVATLGQISAAEDPDRPSISLEQMTTRRGDHVEPLFDAATTAALLVFFAYALQCMSTIAVMRRETGTWRWPAIAFSYLFALAWSLAFVAHTVLGVLT